MPLRVNLVHVAGELPEVSLSSLRSGMTLVGLPSYRRTEMKKSIHLTQVQKLNPQPLHDLVDDIEYAMSKCRAMIKTGPDPCPQSYCFVKLAEARQIIVTEIEKKLEATK